MEAIIGGSLSKWDAPFRPNKTTAHIPAFDQLSTVHSFTCNAFNRMIHFQSQRSSRLTQIYRNVKVCASASEQKSPLSEVQSSGLRVPFELGDRQFRMFHILPSGLKMEVIMQRGVKENNDRKSPIVFVHGSFHAAWCWAVHWLPFFSEAGHDCHAISLLGQGESDVPLGSVAGTLQTHARDIAHFIKYEVGVPPILVGHSFGGLIVQFYLSYININRSFKEFGGLEEPYPNLAAAVLVCSVPPTGNSGLVWRYLLSKPLAAFKVTLSLAAKAFATSVSLCRETFFSRDIPDLQVERYQELLKSSSVVPLFDLRKLNASLPVPPPPKGAPPILVMGAADDFIVDAQGLMETAKFFNVAPVIVEGIAHDMMLDTSWKRGSGVLLSWLGSIY
ncbi:uncharacterized protein LOC131042099 [Cryptomeria japonica]|uniref:uncharacterized protein LOC131042099 n=1 Tax=Cryptomeria japonica TaxID=3369 RepID=UPI0025AC803B|nr:uncharacterized protein LOC131042099 [Cryptomeria japonica]